jgi:tripartite-type tricarboxylate transporter receptor subunit TctC
MVRALLAGLVWLGLSLGPASAQGDYPNRPVKIVVPSTPGGGSDTFGRLVGQHLSDAFGQPFVIDNRPGGGTLIGMEAAANAEPDGYTLYLAPSTVTLLPLVKKSLPVTLDNFSPVSVAAILPYLLVIDPSLKARNIQEFIAFGKQNPGKLTFGSPGLGTGPHMSMQLFANVAGIDMLHVPYRGVANVATDILSGTLSSMMLNMLTAKPHVEAGKLRALGITSLKRDEGFATIPTIAEQGLKDFEALQWFAILAPRRTPQAIVDKLQQEMARGLQTPRIKQQLALQGASPGGNTPTEFAGFLKEETAKWAAVAKAANIQPQ